MNTARIRALIILAIIILAVGFGFYWLFNNSYISVTLNDATNKDITYTFTNQANNKTATVISTRTTVKKRLPRGSYRVQVSQENNSLVAIASASGFMRTSGVTGKLTAERARSFVGNNPSPCMFYNGVLYSFTCGSSLQKVNYHNPANASSPTYVTQPFKNNYGLFQGSVTVKNGNAYVLVKNPAIEDVRDEQQIIYTIGENGALSTPTVLKGVASPSKSYQIKPYKDGFVLYDAAFQEILYYATPATAPTKISVETPKDQKLTGFDLETSDDAILVAYSTIDKDNINDTGNKVKAKNEIVVFRGGKSTHSSLKSVGSVLDFCGDNKLCAMTGESMDVYSFDNDKPRYLYTYNDIQSMTVNSNGVALTQPNQIVQFNVDTRQGYIAYTMGSYSSCGQQTSGNNLILCLINNKSQKVTLLLDMTNPLGDPIDKQVLDLQKQADVTTVSAYKNYISIAPNYGRMILLPGGGYGYDPAVIKVVNDKINAKVKQLRINTAIYTVSGLLPN